MKILNTLKFQPYAMVLNIVFIMFLSASIKFCCLAKYKRNSVNTRLDRKILLVLLSSKPANIVPDLFVLYFKGRSVFWYCIVKIRPMYLLRLAGANLRKTPT